MNLSRLNIELDISAQKILHSLQLYNETLEAQVKAGLELGIQELINEDDFIRTVADATKLQIRKMITDACNDWQLRHRLQDAVTKSIDNNIDLLAKDWADKVTKNLEP